ncbi:MAG: hemin uptake protein HemP [Sulfuricurvum sp.]|nr:hemin uptake protein HemP [Sulfuricurvum sp.]
MLKDDRVIASSSSSQYNGIVIKSEELFINDHAVRIVHGNEIYILRITKANKLILTK